MRLMTLLLLLALPVAVQAQIFRITPADCVQLGETLRIDGRGFGSTPGEIWVTGQGSDRKLKTSRWSPRRVMVVVPSRGLRDGGTYRLVWVLRDGSLRPLGAMTLCAASQRDPESAAPDAAPKRNSARAPVSRALKRTERAARAVVPAPDGAPEYSVLVPARQEQAARTVLEGRGATLLRRRNLPQMGRVMLFYAFPPGLDLSEARAALRIPAPDAALDHHHIYGLAAPPRLYAAALLGDAARRLYSKANTGGHIEFATPGVDLWVITPKGAGYRSGTSYAAPIVTGLLAREAARGGLSLDKARRDLRQGAVDLGPAGRDASFGHGLVQSGGC